MILNARFSEVCINLKNETYLQVYYLIFSHSIDS